MIFVKRPDVARMNGGKGCVPVGVPVFKTGGRRRRVGCGGFDSHAFPLIGRMQEIKKHGNFVI
jgi:hypothetical protein